MLKIKPTIPKLPGAASETWQPFLIESFIGGLNTADPAAALRDDQFTSFLNLYLTSDGRPKVREAYRPWLVSSEDTVIPDSAAPDTFIYVELRGSDYMVAQWDNGSYREVSVYDEVNSRWAGEVAGTTIKATLTDGYKVRFAKFSVNNAEDLLFCNGKDTPQRWVGTIDTASSDLGLSAPSNPTSLATSNTATADKRGIEYNGTYYYKFTAFYDSSGTNTKYGESGPCSAYSVAIAGADISADTTVSAALSNCPAIPTGATKNFVYRSPPDQTIGPYEYVGYYTSGTAYTDTCPEDEKGAECPADGGTPPYLKNIIVEGGRVWGIGLNASEQLANKMVYSKEGQPDFFAATAYSYFPDPVVGPKAFKKNVYVFTEKQIYVYPEADPDQYPNPLKVCDIGCDGYDSIVDVGNGLVWQYNGNIYWSDFRSENPETGDLPWSIGDPIKDKIVAIPAAYRTNSAACYYKGMYFLSITGSGQTVNTATYVWNVEHGVRLLAQNRTGAWTRYDWAANCLQTFNNVLYTADNTNKYIMAHTATSAVDYKNYTDYSATSYNIPFQITTGIMHLGHEWSNKIINSLSLMADSSGVSIIATLSFNAGEFERTKLFTLGSDSAAWDTTWLIWGQGTWGNFNWASSSSSGGIQSNHAQISKGGKGRNIQLTLSTSDGQNTTILGYKIYYKRLPEPA